MQPKLYIVSDPANKNWLSYITGEFIRMNGAGFDIIVADAGSIGDPEDKNIMYHLDTCSSENSMPDRSGVVPCGDVEWLSGELFVVKGTRERTWAGLCPYDLLWNAFVFLSRMEEYQAEKNGHPINSYCMRHPRKDKSTFDIPVVNYLFNEFESLIRRFYPDLRFGRGEAPLIEFSHDVDYISKTVQLRIKQTLLNCYKTARSFCTPERFVCNLSHTVGFLFSSPSYWCFDFWENLEKRYHTRSVFYVYAGTKKKNFKSWLLDPSYDLTSRRFINKLKQLARDGFEIGLHGSYESATDGYRLMAEKALLEERTGLKVTKIRQHWLRYSERETPALHNRYFLHDSTLGWNDRAGFRSGCAGRYRPYDHEHQEPYAYKETPQVIMDSNVFEYGGGDTDKALAKALGLIDCIRRVKSAAISVSWHQRVCSRDYNWHPAYETILKKYLKQRGGGEHI